MDCRQPLAVMETADFMLMMFTFWMRKVGVLVYVYTLVDPFFMQDCRALMQNYGQVRLEIQISDI